MIHPISLRSKLEFTQTRVLIIISRTMLPTRCAYFYYEHLWRHTSRHEAETHILSFVPVNGTDYAVQVSSIS